MLPGLSFERAESDGKHTGAELRDELVEEEAVGSSVFTFGGCSQLVGRWGGHGGVGHGPAGSGEPPIPEPGAGGQISLAVGETDL